MGVLEQAERERELEKIRGRKRKPNGNGGQLFLDFTAADAAAEASPAELVLSWSFDEGVLVCGATRKWKDAIKPLAVGGRRFRYSRRLPGDCAWYIPNSRRKVTEPEELERAAEALRRAGATVEVRYSRPFAEAAAERRRQSFAEREAERAERAEARIERRQTHTGKLERQAAAEWEGSRKATEHIPMGQPILRGHHSEARHRRDIAKAQRQAEKSMETGRKASREAARARTAASRERKRTDPGVIQRRIRRLEAELRSLLRNLHGSEAKGTQLARPPATGEYKRKLEALGADLAEQLDYWRAQLAEELGGAGTWGPEHFKPGDGVMGRYGWAVVYRVSPKSLTVGYLDPAVRPVNPQKLTYERVERRLSPGQQEVLDVMPKKGAALQEINEAIGADVGGIDVSLVKLEFLDAEQTPRGMVLKRALWPAPKKGKR